MSFLILSVKAQTVYQNTAPSGNTWYKIKTRKQHAVTISAKGSYAEYRSVVFLVSGIWNTAEVTTLAEYNYDHMTMDITWGYIGSGSSRYLALKTSPITTTSVSGFTIKELENHETIIELEEVLNPSDVTPISQQSTFHLDEHSKRIGIGTTSPTAKLHVHGGLKIGNASPFDPDVNYYANENYISFRHSGVSEDFLGYKNHTFYLMDSPGGGDTRNPDLIVGGKIKTSEVEVKVAPWSDFVFENDYELRTLEEVEEHITKEGHLPEIPSAAEVTKNGINLGEMDAKLLQKIEELTLYMIDVNKRVNQLEQENTELKESNQELKEKVKSLEN